ncbi:hypothetical protein J2T09_002375 [Neorhizobium huautlense]|uniref:Uncharacterized protein n=1 Tax=Neorhizobium huautlense TaxID=67774 RepID=A0ABT9PT31_9HYPH|nr:hypothetical protein [Neorhizobium huautlense]MDP9837623.1 hypothetical protein [Neorhizobium huautlense]
MKKIVVVSGKFHAVAVPQNPCAWYLDTCDIKAEIADLRRAYGVDPEKDVKVLETVENGYGIAFEGKGEVLARFTSHEDAQRAANRYAKEA